MGDPITATFMAVGTGLSVFGGLQQANTASEAATLEALAIQRQAVLIAQEAQKQAALEAEAIAREAEAIAQAAQYEQAIALRNQEIAELAAEDARERGRVKAAAEARRTKQLIALQRVALAGQGQLVDFGSALDLTADTAATGKLDELTIRNNAEREALGFEVGALNFESDAELARLRADAAIEQGTLQQALALERGASTARIALEQARGGIQSALIRGKAQSQAATFDALGSLFSGGASISNLFS